jgi:hypothetical protein
VPWGSRQFGVPRVPPGELSHLAHAPGGVLFASHRGTLVQNKTGEPARVVRPEAAGFARTERLHVHHGQVLLDGWHPRVLPENSGATRMGQAHWPAAVDVVALGYAVHIEGMRAGPRRIGSEGVQ